MSPAHRATAEAVAEALRFAHRALQRKDSSEARRWARLAVRLDPTNEAAWLTLAGVSEPRAGLAYAARALAINPRSRAARKAIHWLVRRLPPRERPAAVQRLRLPDDLKVQLVPAETLTFRRLVSPRAAIPALGLAFAIGLWVGGQPADARQPQQDSSPVPKASFTPTPTNTPTATATATATLTPTPTNTPTPRPNVSWDYVLDPAELANEGRWIDVDLSEQRVIAYEGTTPVMTFIVSTGKRATPTVTGTFRIYVKLRSTPMAGPGYYLPGVPFTMYFYEGYGLHGTYWHNNFGTPMSRGCVNLSVPDSEWLFGFAEVGTLVNVHP
ncbi:MAG TPA: L,D-transpeptidase family protein [Anaerolineales bacterium]|nr:L,D-transpeptidase family protein [Anaerolineales bacterium]